MRYWEAEKGMAELGWCVTSSKRVTKFLEGLGGRGGRARKNKFLLKGHVYVCLESKSH